MCTVHGELKFPLLYGIILFSVLRTAALVLVQTPPQRGERVWLHSYNVAHWRVN